LVLKDDGTLSPRELWKLGLTEEYTKVDINRTIKVMEVVGTYGCLLGKHFCYKK